MNKNKSETYEIIDSGAGRKLESFAGVLLDRPAPGALWAPQLSPEEWKKADGAFIRKSDKESFWNKKNTIPESWKMTLEGISFRLSATSFGHIGIFPEQAPTWNWLKQRCLAEKNKGRTLEVLNLFAYTGGSSIACALGGAKVCHVDASRPVVSWAKENAEHSGLQSKGISWILDDVGKFIKRSLRKGRRFDGIILDPPSFGRGPNKEVFKLESDLCELLGDCANLLSDDPSFLLLSSHTPGLSAIGLENFLRRLLPFKEQFSCGEMLLPGNKNSLSLPAGCWAKWS